MNLALNMGMDKSEIPIGFAAFMPEPGEAIEMSNVVISSWCKKLFNQKLSDHPVHLILRLKVMK